MRIPMPVSDVKKRAKEIEQEDEEKRLFGVSEAARMAAERARRV